MKNLYGYVTAAVCALITFILIQLGTNYSAVVGMVYPFIIRTLEEELAKWSSQAGFLIWQLVAVVLLVIALTTLVVDILLRRSIVRWFGWVLACASLIFTLHTAVYGLNLHAGALQDDLRLEISDFSLQELTAATEYYRNQANSYAQNVNRDSSGSVVFDDFAVLAERAASGFQYLTYQRFYPVFAGSTQPVKELGWANFFSSLGMSGFTFPLTGEAAVNPQTPDAALPFMICREMAHRMCLASDRDADFAAFLACSCTSNKQYQYSAYFMAYRYCYDMLLNWGGINAAQAAQNISAGVNSYLAKDLQDYENFFHTRKSTFLSGISSSLTELYLKVNQATDTASSSEAVGALLVKWHIQEVVLPATEVIEEQFDPYDESQVDLSGIVHARVS